MVRIENSHPIHGRQRRRVRHRRCLGAVVQFREETTPKTYVSALLRPPTPTTRTAAAATSRPCSRRRGRRLPESSYSPPPTDPGSRVGSNTSRPGRSRPPRTAAPPPPPPPPSRRRRSSTATHQLKQAEETLKKNPSASSSASGSGEVYKGIHGYTDYKAGFRREHTVSSEKAGGSHGPLRASAHIRVSARFDYQPDICKDYKETGYCGYGDSCKFMHDRGDYKSWWQLEKEYEEAEKARKRRIAMGGGDGSDDEAAEDDDDDDDEEAVPFACYICRQPFVDPVVTKCKHYFCEHCALKHHSKNKKCFVCNKPTLGIFNAAQEIRRKMAQDKQQQDG